MWKRAQCMFACMAVIVLAGCGSAEQERYSGMIEGVEVAIVTEVGGPIVQLPVNEGQTVRKGDLLAVIDPALYQAQVEEAQAAVEAAQAAVDGALAGARDQELAKAWAQMEEAEAQIHYLQAQAAKMDEAVRQRDANLAQAQSQLSAARAALDFERKSLEDLERLLDAGLAPQQQVDAQAEAVRQAEAAVARLESQLAALEAEKAMAVKDREAVATQIQAARAKMRAAQANLELLEEGVTAHDLKRFMAQKEMAEARRKQSAIQLSKTRITAPVDGVVTRRHVSLGETVKPGYRLMTLLEEERLEVHVYVPEAELDHVSVGQEVEVYVDAYPDVRFRGKVAHIAEEAEFTPKNVQTADERTKMVFRVKIQLTDGWGKLKPGMPADVRFPAGEGL